MQALGFSLWRDTAADFYLALAAVAAATVLATPLFLGS